MGEDTLSLRPGFMREVAVKLSFEGCFQHVPILSFSGILDYLVLYSDVNKGVFSFGKQME